MKLTRRAFFNRTACAAGAMAFSGILNALASPLSAGRVLEGIYMGGDSVVSPDKGYAGFAAAHVKDIAKAEFLWVCGLNDCNQDYWDTMGWVVEKCMEELAGLKPKLLHFNQGLNTMSWLDKLTAEQRKTRLDKFKSDLALFFDRATADTPGLQVIYATTLPTDDVVWGDNSSELGARRRIENIIAYNAAAVEVSKNKNIVVHDIFTYAYDNKFLRIDGTHFIDEHRALIGKNVADFLRPYILNIIPVQHHPQEIDNRYFLSFKRINEGSVAFNCLWRGAVGTIRIYSAKGFLLDTIKLENGRALWTRTTIVRGSYILKLDTPLKCATIKILL